MHPEIFLHVVCPGTDDILRRGQDRAARCAAGRQHFSSSVPRPLTAFEFGGPNSNWVTVSFPGFEEHARRGSRGPFARSNLRDRRRRKRVSGELGNAPNVYRGSYPQAFEQLAGTARADGALHRQRSMVPALRGRIRSTGSAVAGPHLLADLS